MFNLAGKRKDKRLRPVKDKLNDDIIRGLVADDCQIL